MSKETYTPIINKDGRLKVKDYSDIYVPDRDLREFIVKACNSHDALVEACEGAMRISELWRVDPEINLENPTEGQALDAMMQEFEAALALAKKKA